VGYIIETDNNNLFGEVRSKSIKIARMENLEGFDLIEVDNKEWQELKDLIKKIEDYLKSK